MASILDTLHQHTERHPDKRLFAFLDIQGRITESYSYREFLQRTADIAAHVQRAASLSPGDRVLLAYPPGVEMIGAFFACVRLGLIPVPVYPPPSQGFQAARYKMNFIARDSGASAVLTNRSLFWSMKLNQTRSNLARFSFRSDAASRLTWIVSDEADKNADLELREAHSDILFLQYTSGSTNEPRGVMVTHENILTNGDDVVDHLPVGVSWLPQYHDMGLIGYYLFFALKGGTTYGFSPLDFIQRPALWLESLSRFQATASSAPNFAYEYCLRPDKIPAETLDGLDLSAIRFLMTAAEPVRASTYRRFRDRFEAHGLNPEAFFSAYGLAEYTLAVTNYGRSTRTFRSASLAANEAVAATPGDAPEETRSLVSCGRVLGDTELCIVATDDTKRRLADGEVGEVWISGSSKCRGYWGRPELTREIFEARLPEDPDPSRTWLRSGDLGFLLDHELHLCGRTKDLIIIRGMNHHPQDIEIFVEQDPAIRPGCIAAFAQDTDEGEELVIVAELKSATRLPDAGELQRSIRAHLGITADAFVFIAPRTIPKTSSGKLMRHQTRAQWTAGELQVLHEVRGSELLANTGAPGQERAGAEDTVASLFHDHGLTGTESGTLSDAGLDSLRIAEFAHDLKAHLEAAGHQDLSQAVDLRLIMKIAVSELHELRDLLARTAPRARLRFKRALSSLQREHQAHERRLMAQDSRLRFDARALLADAAPHDPARGGILLTGGTGFFGPFLLKSLLEQTEENIHVLVRGANEAEAKERLWQGLASIGESPSARPPEWEERLHPVCGDLAKPSLGLNEKNWRHLAENIHAIFHNGALVNYLFDYATMRDVNVGGTNEIIRLALSGRAKILNHISTTFVFGWSVEETLFEEDTNADMRHLDFGYSQSKWVSEQVVLDAMEQGLDARIFRPALISPSIEGGGYNFDISIRLLAFMLQHRMGTTAQNQVSFSPADLAADNIVAIAGVPESLGATFHVTRDHYASMLDVTQILSDMTGREFTNFALEDFVPEVIDRCQKDDLLFPLLNFFVRSIDNITEMEFKRYDNSNFQRFRSESPAGREDPPWRTWSVGSCASCRDRESWTHDEARRPRLQLRRDSDVAGKNHQRTSRPPNDGVHGRAGHGRQPHPRL